MGVQMVGQEKEIQRKNPSHWNEYLSLSNIFWPTEYYMRKKKQGNLMEKDILHSS